MLQEEVLGIPLCKGLMKRVQCFLSRQEEAIKPGLLQGKENIYHHIYFSSFQQNKVKFLVLSKIRTTALILRMKNLHLSSYQYIDKKNSRLKASAAEIFAAAFWF